MYDCPLCDHIGNISLHLCAGGKLREGVEMPEKPKPKSYWLTIAAVLLVPGGIPIAISYYGGRKLLNLWKKNKSKKT